MLNEVKSASGGKQNNLIIAVLLVIVFSGASFFAGTKFQQSKTPSFGNFARNGQTGQTANRPGGLRGGGQVVGDILSVDNNSVSVKLPDGSSKIIILSNTSTISKATTGTPADLAVGTRVAVFGTTNSDGSVTAQNIQINPVIRNNINSPTPTK